MARARNMVHHVGTRCRSRRTPVSGDQAAGWNSFEALALIGSTVSVATF